MQRYEGASTIFGPNTLAGYIQEFDKLATYLAKGQQSPKGAKPENFKNSIVRIKIYIIYCSLHYNQELYLILETLVKLMLM